MTYPFASIIATPQDALGHQAERDERNPSGEERAEDVRAEKFKATSVSLKETPFGISQPPSGVETDASLKPCETEKATGLTALPPQQRKPLKGGVYSPEEVLELLNSHYMIGKSEQEVAIFRIKDDGSLAFTPPEQFKLDVANIFVQRPGRSSPIPAEKFWKESPRRHQCKIVFKPDGKTQPGEFNLWRRFGVELRKGWQKQRRFLRHIREVICRRDKKKFKYLIKLLAWMVQNPGIHSGVILVLKSVKQGTGKTTLGNVMLDIFGPHGARIDDKERLLSRFNDWLETVCFALLEEATWAGDHKAADKLKSLVTGDTITVERKFGTCRQVPNPLKTIATTNHEHAVHAGVQDRRNVVYDVSDERVGDKAWFDKLYRDLADGGTCEFLWFLKNLKLGDWHPRQILKTAETAEQQRMSGDSVSQWSQACVNADAVIGWRSGPYSLLGQPIPVEGLREAYTSFCKQGGLRALSTDGFGKACADMFGPRKRLPAEGPERFVQDGEVTQADIELDQEIQRLVGPPDPVPRKRPWGYDVPDGEKWQEKVDARLGIKK